MNELSVKKNIRRFEIKEAGFFLILFLCAFIPFRTPLMQISGKYVEMGIKIIPDLLIATLFVWYLLHKKFRVKLLLQDYFIIAFMLAGFISTIFINNAGIIRYIFQVRSIFIYYVLYFVLRNFGYGKKEYIKMVRMLQVVTCILFVLSIIEKVTSKTVLFPISVAQSILYPSNFARAYGMFCNPNTFGLFLVLVLFLTLFISIHFKEKTNIFIYIAIYSSVLLTMSRSTIIILIVGLIVTIVYKIITNKSSIKALLKKLALSTVIILACVIVLDVIVSFSSSLYYKNVIANSNNIAENSLNIDVKDRLGQMGKDEIIEQSESNGRLYVVKKGIEIFRDYPIMGTGFGTYGSAASLNWESSLVKKYDLPFPLYSDNEYIKILVEGGIVGTILFIGFLLSLLWYYRKDLFKILICVTIGWFGLFFNIFEVQIGAMLLWTILSFESFNSSSKLSRKKLATENNQ